MRILKEKTETFEDIKSRKYLENVKKADHENENEPKSSHVVHVPCFVSDLLRTPALHSSVIVFVREAAVNCFTTSDVPSKR